MEYLQKTAIQRKFNKCSNDIGKNWQFQRSNGDFADYDDNTQKLIQQAVSRNDKIVIISHNNAKYYIDFATGCQAHYPPGLLSAIQRRIK